MKKFETFIFESFQFDRNTLQAQFYYSFDNGVEIFEEVIDFGCEGFEIDELVLQSANDTILNNFLFQLHLALGISYYKLFPTKTLEVKSGYIDDDQIAFWEKFYRNGLGEFFITNTIDPTELLNFKNTSSGISIEGLTIRNNYIETSNNFIQGKSLLLWGGGKDSIVSYSLLKDNKKFDLFVFGKVDDIKKKTATITGEKLLHVKRTLSKNLFKLNQEGYYNGHVPITGIIAFATFVVGYLYGYSNIILSNEASASESNTEWKGIHVNHQYSKSGEFEQDLLKYSQNYISKAITYFSLLGGMYEYKIASIFAGQKEFFSEFSSCNRNFKIKNLSPNGDSGIKKLWCCECEKCAFVFLILSPYLEVSELISIFGENLFEKSEGEQIFRELIGINNHKPFECVGTYDESLLSAKKAMNRYLSPEEGRYLKGDGGINGLPIILENIKTEVLKKCDSETEKKLENKLLKVSAKDIIPKEFTQILLGKKENLS